MNMSRRDKKFRQALLDADQVVADGSGVRFVARLAGKDVGPRIIGQAYFEALMKKLKSRNSGRVYFFGSSEATLNLIDQRFKRDYPELLWVGMTAPKQEVWVYENRRSLDVPVIGSIGAVFDFFAGTVKSSPQWVRTIGLEALYRLAMEPRRLWRRVLISSVTFLIYGSWYELRERMSPSGRQGS
jgi:N-acetylglucosaminyldiphosphoundecaprenol N-acetyl-beta-D-mannosaminyltransferase